MSYFYGRDIKVSFEVDENTREEDVAKLAVSLFNRQKDLENKAAKYDKISNSLKETVK